MNPQMPSTTTSEKHPIDQIPPLRVLLSFGLQHLVIMYTGAITVPYVIGGALGLNQSEIAYLVGANLLICGLGTILTTIGLWRFGARLPIVFGPSANVIAPLVLIGNTHGINTVWGSCIMAGICMIIFAPFFRWLARFFPPVVLGSWIIILGIMLIPVGVKMINGGNVAAPATGVNMAFAAGTIVLIVLLMKLLPKAWSQASLLIGIVVATVIAGVAGQVHFGDLDTNGIIGIATPFHFGAPVFNFGAATPVLIIMLILMLESMAQYTAIGGVVGLSDNNALSRMGDGIRADGLTTLAGGVVGVVPVITFSQNIGTLSLTRVKSRYITATTGLMLVVLGIFPPIGVIVAGIPGSVLGGAALVMFASVAVVGIKVLGQVDFNRTGNLIVVACALGIGLIPMAAPHFYESWPTSLQLIFESPAGGGAIAAVLLNLILNGLPGLKRGTEPGDLR